MSGRIYDRLIAQFGKANIYMDVDAIPLGVDFRDHLTSAVNACELMLVVIGQGWNRRPDGAQPLNDPKDFVRIEIQAALDRDIPVIPILVNNARMPQVSELPASLEKLAFRNALMMDASVNFDAQIERLTRGIAAHLDRSSTAGSATAPEPNRSADSEPERQGAIWCRNGDSYTLWVDGEAISPRTTLSRANSDFVAFDPQTKAYYMLPDFEHRDGGDFYEAIPFTRSNSVWCRCEDDAFALWVDGQAISPRTSGFKVGDDFVAYDAHTKSYYMFEKFKHREIGQLQATEAFTSRGSVWCRSGDAFALWVDGQAISPRTTLSRARNDFVAYDPQTKRYYMLEDFEHRDDGEFYKTSPFSSRGIVWCRYDDAFALWVEGQGISSRTIDSRIDDDYIAYDPQTKTYYMLKDFAHRDDGEFYRVTASLLAQQDEGVWWRGGGFFSLWIAGQNIALRAVQSRVEGDAVAYDPVTKTYYLLTNYSQSDDRRLRLASALSDTEGRGVWWRDGDLYALWIEGQSIATRTTFSKAGSDAIAFDPILNRNFRFPNYDNCSDRKLRYAQADNRRQNVFSQLIN